MGDDFEEIPSSGGGFHKSILVSDHIFLMTSGGKLFVWIGENVDADAKKNAMQTAISFFEKKQLPDYQIQVSH